MMMETTEEKQNNHEDKKDQPDNEIQDDNKGTAQKVSDANGSHVSDVAQVKIDGDTGEAFNGDKVEGTKASIKNVQGTINIGQLNIKKEEKAADTDKLLLKELKLKILQKVKAVFVPPRNINK